MFFDTKNFIDLSDLKKQKNIFLHDYNSYISYVEDNNLSIKQHLYNCINSELVKSFCIPIFTLNSLYEGQATNGLFNPTYIMPEDTFLRNKFKLDELYNIFYKENNNKLSFIFDNTLKTIKKVKGITQSMFVVLKNGCVFSPHTHDKVLIYWLKLDENEGDLFVKVKNEDKVFNNENRELLFDGSLLHSGFTKIRDKSIYLVLAINE